MSYEIVTLCKAYFSIFIFTVMLQFQHVIQRIFFRDKRLSTGEAVIITQGPKPETATLTKTFDAIKIKFDRNLQVKNLPYF